MKFRTRRDWFVSALALVHLAFFAACPLADAEPAAIARHIVAPKELPDAVLHNPDMGWVLYENYPLDQDPHGSSTMLLLPNENFAGVDSVAIMFSWQDVETSPDEYDFSKVDSAYDYWARHGKAIQLRLSSESLLWWTNKNTARGPRRARLCSRKAFNERKANSRAGGSELCHSRRTQSKLPRAACQVFACCREALF